MSNPVSLPLHSPFSGTLRHTLPTYRVSLLHVGAQNGPVGVNQSTQPTSLCVNSRIYPKDDRLPIVVADRIWFLQMAHYSAPEIASRLVCLTGTANVARSPGLNQGTGTLIRWRDILPGTIEAYRTFLNRNREFWLLYHNQGGLEWLPLQFKADGYGWNTWPRITTVFCFG